jgi:adenylyltransferase/sulfurtransferase
MCAKLTQEEVIRYQRHLSLPEFGLEAQLKLKAAKVLVIGAGGLGCPVLQYLAAAGVGVIGIVDDDVVDVSNLQRQILFDSQEIGEPKALRAQAKLQAMNPLIQCVAHAVRIGVENAREIVELYDLVVDCSDNFATRYLVNDVCVLTDKALVYGALYTFQGQVSVFNFQGGPTYRCLFASPPKPEEAPNCAEIGVVGVLPGVIGCLQATEVIKLITGVGAPLSGKLLLFDALSMQSQTVHFERVPAQADVRELVPIQAASCQALVPAVSEIQPEELNAELANYQLLDVREEWERAAGALPGAHLPLGALLQGPVDLHALGLDAERPICVYCQSGKRSLRAIQHLAQLNRGLDWVNLAGGLNAWNHVLGRGRSDRDH